MTTNPKNREVVAPAESPPGITDDPLAQVLEGLPEDLCYTLAVLHQVGDEVAEITLQTLPFGSRSVLEVAKAVLLDPQGDGPQRLTLTPLGRALIARCAARRPLDSERRTPMQAASAALFGPSGPGEPKVHGPRLGRTTGRIVRS